AANASHRAASAGVAAPPVGCVLDSPPKLKPGGALKLYARLPSVAPKASTVLLVQGVLKLSPHCCVVPSSKLHWVTARASVEAAAAAMAAMRAQVRRVIFCSS